MNIIKWDGNTVSTPGIVSGLGMDFYHSDCCAGPSISSSGLRTIENSSLAHYWATSYLNPKRIEVGEKAHFSIGKAAAHLIGGEAEFYSKFAVRPDEFDSWRTKAAQEWRDAKLGAGLTVITPDDIETIRGMADTLAAHPTIRAGILQGLVEHSIFWQDAETGVWLKARPDVIPVDANMLVDLKTCASAHPQTVRRAIADYGYHMQLGLAHEGMMATTGREMTDHVLVFVEKSAPYCVNIKPIPTEDIELGRRQLRRAIRKFANALETNEWPGYEDDEVPAHLPEFYRRNLLLEADAGLLPEL